MHCSKESRRLIGRIERGFDFLGYHFSPAGLTVAAKTIANFIEKASRLYEQKRSAVLAVTALEMYSMRWLRWANGGLVIPRADAAHTDGLFAFGRVEGGIWQLETFIVLSTLSPHPSPLPIFQLP